ncbi:hypothetical protein D9619_010292 [Psilocybe cf. subviscida]|uniref:Uncharacterized protein n=1 Tax=Psilocybe cf. subviscida TaxID=2480587 RepID=A0A8H5AT44_9AGAR|nr:hypothetical protein D9619_010292 [Psilocybe cf. subviscida]
MKVSSMQRVIQKIPLEIYLEILSHFGPPQEYKSAPIDLKPDMTSLRNRTIRSMALVCRGFYHHFFPYLFENIYLYADIMGNCVPSHCTRFCESIVRGDQRAQTLAAYVKTYAIVGFTLAGTSQNRPEPVIQKEDLSVYSKSVGFMSNLQELHLFYSSITNDLLHATQSLPPLKLLRIDRCNVPCPLDGSSLQHFASLQVASVYEDDTSFNDSDGNESEPCRQLLKHFCLTHTKYLQSSLAHCHFLNRLALHPPMLHLQWVHIPRLMILRYLSALSDALKAMPNLTSFQIGRIEYLLSEGRAVRTLHNVSSVANATKHPITEEDIVFEGPAPYEKDVGFWKSVAEVFKKSQRAIEELDVPMSFYCNVSFASHFPDLWLLTIRPKHINWFDKDDAADGPFGGQPDTIIAAFLGSWCDHPKLIELEFAYDRKSCPFPAEENEDGMVRYGGLNVSDDILHTLKSRIPTLQWLKFTVNPPRYDDEESFEFYLGEEDELETVDSHSEASMGAEDQS